MSEQAWEDMRAYNIRLEERAREAERALARALPYIEAAAEKFGGHVQTEEDLALARAVLRPSEDTSDES